MQAFATRWALALNSAPFSSVQASGVVLDSGSTYTYLGPSDFANYVTYIKAASGNSNCNETDGELICPCSGLSTTTDLNNKFPTF